MAEVNDVDYEDNAELYGDETAEDPELEMMQKRVQEMEEEHEKLSKMQQQVERQISTAAESIEENSMYDKSLKLLYSQRNLFTVIFL